MGVLRLFSFIFGLLAAAMAYGEVFEVKTTPDKAVVYVSVDANKAPVKLGTTPLKMTSEEVFAQTGDTKSFVMSIEKDGHDPYRIMMIKTPGVDYQMDILLTVRSEVKTIKKHDLLMGELFKAQRLIRASNFSDALTKLNDLEKDYKDFSIISEMKGIAYYMKKDLNSALSMFRQAFSKNSENRDAYKMKVYLEKKMGLDAEAR